MHTFVVVLGAGLLVAKLVTEALLLFVSYAVQQRYVFARRRGGHPTAVAADAVPTASEGAGRAASR